MTKFTITALLAMACGARIAATAQTTSPDPQLTIQLHVQPGDSLTNLFGSDWQEVYQLNRCECRFASYINDANDPNFIFAGSSLAIPPDVHLTERALANCLVPFRPFRRSQAGTLHLSGYRQPKEEKSVSSMYQKIRHRQRELSRRISQSMSDSPRPNAKCHQMQRKLACLQRIKKLLRRV
jgi:hypothetical protein